MEHARDQIARLLRAEDDFLVVSHTNPDGDALGAQAGLAHLLTAEGKAVRLYNASGVPEMYDWLNLGAELVTSLEGLGARKPRVAVLVDCSEAHRTGPEFAGALRERAFPQVIIIDHHAGTPAESAARWIDPAQAATCQMIGDLALHMGHALAGPLGEAVYLGLSGDTGNFSFANTSPAVLDMAAAIVRNGLDVGAFADKTQNVWSLARLHLWGELFARVGLAGNGRVSYIVVPPGLVEKFGLNSHALEDFASWLRRLQGVRIGLFIRSAGPGKSKISLRSAGPVDVRPLAARFGGGGHANAVGITLDVEPEDALRLLLPLVEETAVAADMP